MMLEYELKKKLDVANAQLANLSHQIELYEKLKKVLEEDVDKRDKIIAAQDSLITILKEVNSIQAAQPVMVFPPPPFFSRW